MKKQVSYLWMSIFICFFASCSQNRKTNEPTTQIPSLKLPVKIRAERFFQKSDKNLGYLSDQLAKDSILFVGQFKTEKFTVYLKKKHGKFEPIIYTRDKNNKLIDKLVLFDRFVHVGTDSNYLPWILINENLEITKTDTSYYYQPIVSWPEGKDVSINDTFIGVEKFKINKYGYFVKKYSVE